MYQAPIVASLIGVSIVWNKVGCLLEKKGYHVPLFLHHYGMMYFMLITLFIICSRGMYFDIMVPSQWLDADATKAFVSHRMIQDSECTATSEDCETFKDWEAESTLDGKLWVREFSLLCPVWTALTLAVCIYHTHQHINRIRYDKEGKPLSRKLVDCPEHNMTMTVLILPAVYGLMSFKSTCRMWQVMINHIPGAVGNHDIYSDKMQSYSERKTFLLEMYEANFMVGDIYETYALVTFGWLVVGVVNKDINVKKGVFEKSDKTEDMHKHIDIMLGAMQRLTIAGVQLFALSCFLQGAYNLIITTMAFDFEGTGDAYFSRKVNNSTGQVGMFQQEAIRTMSHYFFLGAGFIASFAAINNLMTIEHDFEEILHEFQPFFKFWGTKILVSLAFLQSILISVFLTHWSEIQSNLLYSSVLCLECLLIAIFHLKGWGADEPWYHDYDTKLRRALTERKLTESLLNNSSTSNVPDESK